MMDLEIVNLAVGYKNKALLKDVNLSFAKGELVCISANNGVGKSSFLYTLMGLTPPISGEILFQDLRLDTLKANERKKYISMVFANTGSRPIIKTEEALVLGNEGFFSNNSSKAKEQLEKENLQHLIGKSINKLSDGQYQKLMICRVLLHDTPIILLDEPTSFLDYENKQWLYQKLTDLCKQKNKTILVATHDLDLIAKYQSKRVDLGRFIEGI